MVPVRETSKPCAPFLSRIRFTWYRNTTAESRGAVSFRRGTFLSPLRAEPVPLRTNESTPRVVSFFLSLLPFDDFSNTFAILEDQLLLSSHPHDLLRQRSRSIRFFPFVRQIFMDFLFFSLEFFTSYLLGNFIKPILKTFLSLSISFKGMK